MKFNLGDLVEIKKRYKRGYARDISESVGLIIENCKKTKKAKVLFPTRDNKISLFLYLLNKVKKNVQ